MHYSAVTARPLAALDMRAFGLLLRMHAKMYSRNCLTLVMSLLLPMVYMFFLGFANTGQIGNFRNGHAAQVLHYLMPGIILLSLLSTGLVGNSTLLAMYRVRGILKRVQLTTVPLWQFALSRVVVQSVAMVAQSMALITAAVLIFGAEFEAGGLLAATPALLLGAITFTALGYMVAALVRKPEGVAVITQFVYLPLLFLSGVFVSLDSLPAVLRDISRWLPGSVVQTIIRAPLLGDAVTDTSQLPLGSAYAVMLAYFIAATLIGALFFKWE